MIAKLIFKLPEDETAFNLAQKGADYAYHAHEFDNWLRGFTKHSIVPDELRGLDAEPAVEVVLRTLFFVRERFNEGRPE